MPRKTTSNQGIKLHRYGYWPYLVVIALMSVVTPLSALTVTEIQSISFGFVPNQNGLCQLRPNGNLQGICSGSGLLGHFLVEGNSRATFVVSLPGPQVIAPGVTFTPLIQKNNHRLSRNGTKEIKIYADLEINNSQGGDLDMMYTITVNYL